MKTIFASIGVFVSWLILFIVTTPLCVFFGWVVGLTVKLLCGNFVADGLNILLGTERFTADVIPIIGGTLGFIGSFFKSMQSSNSNNNNRRY